MATPDVDAGPGTDPLDTLRDQRDFLLASLRDLEAERAAGDLDEDDYVTLRDDYTARAASVLRAIEAHRPAPTPRAAAGTRLRALAWVAGVVAFALIAGVLVARSSGRRGADDAITGDIRLDTRQRLAECQQALGARAVEEAVDCFDEVLAADPGSAEALTYRGWALAVGSFGDGQGGDAELLDEALSWVDRALEVDEGYPDALALRIVLLDRTGRADELPDAFAAFDAVDAPADVRALVDGLRAPSGSPALECRYQIDSGEVPAALRCFEEVLAEDPDDVEALAWKGWALALAGLSARQLDDDDLAVELLEGALETVDEALAVDADSTEALAFRAIVLDALGRPAEADEALVQLFALDPDPALVAGLEQHVPDARSRADADPEGTSTP